MPNRNSDSQKLFLGSEGLANGFMFCNFEKFCNVVLSLNLFGNFNPSDPRGGDLPSLKHF